MGERNIHIGQALAAQWSAPARSRPLNIGVMGGAAGDNASNPAVLRLAEQQGEAIAAQGDRVVTGICPGIPDATAQAAFRAGGFTIGISPADSEQEHVRHYHSPVDGYSLVQYTGMGLMQRDILNIRTSDAVIIEGGRTGTSNEATIALMEGKPVGVLQGTGGLADGFQRVMQICGEGPRANVIYSHDPVELAQRLAEVTRKYPAGVHVDGALIDRRPSPIHVAEASTLAATPIRSAQPAAVDDGALTIGVLGSKGDSFGDGAARRLAAELGQTVAEQHYALLASAVPGPGYIAARACRDAGGFTMGISPADSGSQHDQEYHAPSAGFSKVQYTGLGMMQSSIMDVRSSDAVVVVGGDIRTLNEFAIAWKEDKPIGVLTGSGGLADGLQEVLSICGEQPRPNVVFSSDARELVQKLAELSKVYPKSMHNDGFLIDQNIDRG